MRKWLVSMLGAAAMALSAGALAQAYVGLDIGNADIGPEDDTALRLFGGWQFHRNIAAEVGVSRLFDKGGAKVEAIEVVAVGIIPIVEKISALVRLGIAAVDFSPGDNKTELTFGFGAQYDFTPNLGVRAQWQRYDTPTEIDLLSIGVLWKF